MTKTKGLVLVALAGAILWCGALQLRARAAEQQARAEAERQRAEAVQQRAAAETEALRAQLEALRRENATLKAALQAAQQRVAPGVGAMPAVLSARPLVRPIVAAGPPEAELLKVRAEAKRAELEAARLGAEEARRRVDRLEKLAKSAAASEDDVAAARVAAVRHQAEARVKEAEMAEILIRLKYAEQHAAPPRPEAAPGRAAPADRRIDELHEQVRKLEQALDQLRREQRERRGP